MADGPTHAEGVPWLCEVVLDYMPEGWPVGCTGDGRDLWELVRRIIIANLSDEGTLSLTILKTFLCKVPAVGGRSLLVGVELTCQDFDDGGGH